MALSTDRSRARWLVVVQLLSAAAACWEIGAEAGRVRVAARFLGGQTVSLAAAGASDSYVLLASLAVMFALGAVLMVFVRWVRRARRKPVVSTVLVVWWVLWVLANIVGRVVELTYQGTSSLTDVRNVALIDAGDCVLLIASLLVMVVVVRRAETRDSRPTIVGAAAAVRSRRVPVEVEPEPASPVASRRGPVRALAVVGTAVAVIAAPLAVAFVVSNGTANVPHPAATSAPQSGAWQASNAVATTCSDAMFQPNGAIAAGAGSACANLTLGTSLFTADCTKGAVPTVLSPEIFDNTGQSSVQGTVKAAAGACALTTTSTSVTTALLAGDAQGPANEPGSVVVVADFIPADNPSGLNTIGVRVSSTAELDVAIQSDGGYAVIESTGGATPQALLQGNLSSTGSKAPDLAREVRVVVSVDGSTAAAYIDGLRIGIGPTSVPNTPGGCGFSLSTNDASKPVVAKLLHLEIFAAG
jgi:hypothetical protein